MAAQPLGGGAGRFGTQIVDDDAGAFPGERLVTVSTETGPVSGFAKADFVIDRDDGTYLVAEVKRVSRDKITVRLFGSFFTTTGLADIPKGVALQKFA